MNIGIIGLGKMGHGIAERVVASGMTVFGYDVDHNALQQARQIGVHCVDKLILLPEKTKVLWLMLPAGDMIDKTIDVLSPYLTSDHIIVDGGNSYFKDSIRRAQLLEKRGIHYLDCGTSGGVHGKEIGFSLMVGGDRVAYEDLIPLLQIIAAPQGYGLMGPSGSGHYVKMIHNGIEYALLQAYAEGFHIIKEGHYHTQHLDLAEITRVWQHGSIVRSYILDLAHQLFKQDQTLVDVSGEIEEGGTGRWALQEARDQHIPAPMLDDALRVRAFSRETGGNFATKVIAMLRYLFGGHAVHKKQS